MRGCSYKRPDWLVGGGGVKCVLGRSLSRALRQTNIAAEESPPVNLGWEKQLGAEETKRGRIKNHGLRRESGDWIDKAGVAREGMDAGASDA